MTQIRQEFWRKVQTTSGTFLETLLLIEKIVKKKKKEREKIDCQVGSTSENLTFPKRRFLEVQESTDRNCLVRTQQKSSHPRVPSGSVN